jgi:hypothetical protein
MQIIPLSSCAGTQRTFKTGMLTPRLNVLLFAVLVSLTCSCGQASSLSERFSLSRGEPTSAYPSAQPASGAYLVVPADHRLFMVQITSKQEVLANQLSELVAARDALRKALESVGEMTAFRVGDPALSGQSPGKEKGGRSEYNAVMVQAVFKQANDPLKQIADFVKAVAAIKPPVGALWSFALTGTSCSLENPERYREQLVAKAMDGLHGLRSVDTSRFKVSIAGLEKPLTVSQCSDTEFIVALQHTVTVESVSEFRELQKPKTP